MDDDQEKTEQPTDKKLLDARDKGQVTKSIEINSLAVFGTGLILIYITKGFLGKKIFDLAFESLNSLDKLNLNTTILQTYMLKWVLFLFSMIMPILIGIVIMSLVSNIAQVGFKFSSKILSPNLGKFNPINGIKRLFFSSRSFVEVAKSVAKLSLISTFAYFVVSGLIKDTLLVIGLTLEDTLSFMLDAAFSMIWKIVMLFVLIASVDYLFQRFKFNKQMMMSKQELKEEFKQSEGNPKIKAKIRRQMLQNARRRMMHDVPSADVVITNPTHYAIALKYEIDKYNAPKIVAKGMDELAQRIKKVALENNIPIHEDKELARALFKICDVGDFIPTKLFKAVAQILAYIFQMKKAKKKRSIV